jgi:hypothetical protein
MASRRLLKQKTLWLSSLVIGLSGLPIPAMHGVAKASPLEFESPPPASDPITLASPFALCTFTAGAAGPAIRGAVTGGTTLPKDVASYGINTLHPAGWASSDLLSITGGQSGGYVQDASGANVHAAFWAASTASIIDLHPTSGTYSQSHVLGEGARQIVGVATVALGSFDHAMLWTMGQGNNSVDLNPAGFKSSYAKSTNGFLQAGYGYINSSIGSHALLWTGSAGSVMDINPTGFFSSEALGASGGFEVGDGGFVDSKGAELHAMLWAGTSNVPVDLHPTNLSLNDSRAVTISGTTVGGYGTDAVTGSSHAIAWTALSPNTAIDLNPRGYFDSQVVATNGAIEVGFGHVSNDSNSLHALLWTSASNEFLDLNQYLPANYGNAMAQGIDAQGNVVGFALDKNTNQYEAVVWNPIAMTPEPTALLPLAGLLGSLVLTRKRAKK